MALTILYISSQQRKQTFKQILNDIDTTLHQLQIDLYKPNLLHFRFMKKLGTLPKFRALASKESQSNEILSEWHASAFNIKCIWKYCLQNVSHFCSGLNVTCHLLLISLSMITKMYQFQTSFAWNAKLVWNWFIFIPQKNIVCKTLAILLWLQRDNHAICRYCNANPVRGFSNPSMSCHLF